ncbi:unnamed protein product [Clavelina lepadiformis]|uniref:Uncharacterized protein n=1 Tax=Clavelina lepadiformis TaxID=159417 RepID=A0ABP0GZB0_CLALP
MVSNSSCSGCDFTYMTKSNLKTFSQLSCEPLTSLGFRCPSRNRALAIFLNQFDLLPDIALYFPDEILAVCSVSYRRVTEDSFYNEDDDDDFVEDTDNSAWQKDSNLLTNLLDEDSLGQLAAVHNKYHQLKCHLNSLRGGDPNKPSTSLDLIQNDLVDTIIAHAQEPEIVVTSPTRNRKKTGRYVETQKKLCIHIVRWTCMIIRFSFLHSRKLSAGSSEVSASERAQRVSEIKQRALKSKVNTSSRSLRYHT